MASTTILIYAMLAAVGLVLGPFALRFALGVAPGGLKKRAAKWQLHRALNMGDGWLVHQTGDRQYVLRPIRPDAGALDIDGERVDLDNLGHIACIVGPAVCRGGGRPAATRRSVDSRGVAFRGRGGPT